MSVRCLALALVVFVAGCNSPAAPSSLNLTGTWDVTSVVTGEGTDFFLMELRQEADSLSGTFTHADLVGPIVLSGSVKGRVASVDGVLPYADGACSLTVTTELAIARDGRTLSGPMTSAIIGQPACKPGSQASNLSAVKR
jgi:hypothetical protein